jgi:hypothetical protein
VASQLEAMVHAGDNPARVNLLVYPEGAEFGFAYSQNLHPMKWVSPLSKWDW